MARIEDIERRLLNWARWRTGGSVRPGGLGIGGGMWSSAGEGRSGYRESVIPTVDCEAAETHDAVQALPEDLRATVELVYTGIGGLADKAAQLGCSVKTLHARVDQAHRRIQAWLVERHALRRAARERVERLQASARPAEKARGEF